DLIMMKVIYVVFFFQAEDGIRDKLVTGVQTCALPICGFFLILQRSMEDEKKSTQNPQRDQCAATPISTLETRLTIFTHDGLPLLTEGKAQIGPCRANLDACSSRDVQQQ